MTRTYFTNLFFHTAITSLVAAATASLLGCSGDSPSDTMDMAPPMDMNTAQPAKPGSTVYSVPLGGGDNDAAYAVTTDAAGNVYVAGQLTGPLDLGGGVLMAFGMSDVYVAKFDSSGKHQWSKSFGGTGPESIKSLRVDRSGNLWAAGSFRNSVDFGGGALNSAGFSDVFLLSLGTVDGAYRAAYRYGGANDENVVGLAIDSTGSPILTGAFSASVDFGGGMLTSAGGTDGYILKVSPAGVHQWSKRFGDAYQDTGGGLAVGPGDDVNLVATFIGSADVGGGKVNAADLVAADILVARFAADGTHKWSKGVGARSDALLPSIAIDDSGNLLLMATFDGNFSMGGAIFSSDGLYDVVVAKWDPSGSHLWSYRFAGPDYDLPDGIAADAQGNVIAVGHYKGNSRMAGGSYLKSYGSYDGWIAKLAPSGQHLWSQHYGGIGDDSANAVSVDAQGNIWLAGQFTATAELGKGPVDSRGGIDSFLLKIAP